MQIRTTGTNIATKVNNIITYYDDLGEGKATLVFIHGFPFNKSSWKPQLDLFKGIYRVIAYDLRGFGQSTIDEKELSMDLLADDLISLMNHLQVNKAIVCALSMGGYILLNALSRYPERIQAAILCDTQCIGDSPEQKEKRYESVKKIKAEGLLYFTDEFVKKVFCEDSLVDKKIIVEEIRTIIKSTPAESIMRMLAALAERPNMCTSLPKIAVPTLILSGKQDGAVPIAQSEYLHKHIKGSLFYGIEKAGHLPNLEQPDEFNKHISDFIIKIVGS